MAVFKEEFLQWKQSVMTAELSSNIQDQIANLAAEMVRREEPNANRDQLLRGVIQGLTSVLEWQPEFLEVELEEEEQNDDEV